MSQGKVSKSPDWYVMIVTMFLVASNIKIKGLFRLWRVWGYISIQKSQRWWAGSTERSNCHHPQ